jgi:hypothetical protein
LRCETNKKQGKYPEYKINIKQVIEKRRPSLGRKKTKELKSESKN